jgi:hypothetical protein
MYVHLANVSFASRYTSLKPVANVPYPTSHLVECRKMASDQEAEELRNAAMLQWWLVGHMNSNDDANSDIENGTSSVPNEKH